MSAAARAMVAGTFLRKEHLVSRTRLRLVSLLTAIAVAVGVPAGAAFATTAKTPKPHAGQYCSPKKTPPAGFKCVKDKKGKYRLKKR